MRTRARTRRGTTLRRRVERSRPPRLPVDATRAFGDFDDALDDRARDATAETLVNNFDISPVVRAHDGVGVVDEDDETRYCTSCKQYLSAERFPGAHRTCATCLFRHKLYQQRKRKKSE